MRWIAAISISLVAACPIACHRGGGASSSSGDAIGYDSEGNSKPCPEPRSNCEETIDATLDFKDRCSEAGFSMQLCGCEQLCMGNIVGKRQGFDAQNKEKGCEAPSEKCELPETSAAFQDGCSESGGKLMECECEWLCSDKLKEPVPAAPAASEDKAEGEEGKDGEKAGKDADKKPHGNMDGEIPAGKKGKK
jgi:hypothetical protein